MTNPETSSDLVKRLRTGKLSYMSDSGPVWEGGDDLLREAATTIERLTVENKRLADWFGSASVELAEAQALVARQAEAMKEISRHWCQFINCRNDSTGDPAEDEAEEQRNVEALSGALDRARSATESSNG